MIIITFLACLSASVISASNATIPKDERRRESYRSCWKVIREPRETSRTSPRSLEDIMLLKARYYSTTLSSLV